MVAFLYPGQGSQEPGMGTEFLRYPWALEIFQEAERVLGYPPLDALRDPEKLGRTSYVQPLLLLVERLITAALEREARIVPDAVCGHSLGEYAALAAAGVIGWDEALRLVALRGRLMEEAAQRHPGAMAAILAPTAEAERIAAEAGCFAVNYNAPEQVVVSGERSAVARALELARARGFRAVPLKVSGPFHTPLMREAEEALRGALEEVPFRKPRVTFVSGVSGRQESDPERIRALMEIQMTRPVRWTEVVRALEDLEIAEAVEVGPGQVLTRLGRRTSEAVNFRSWREYVELQG
ncbi:ACP S-malonyltransferase [Candidatus Bipolaricaulota sp. J31]